MTLARHGERRADPEWLARAWSGPRARLLLLTPDGGFAQQQGRPRWVAPAGSGVTLAQTCYLGSDAGNDYFSAIAPVAAAVTLRELAVELAADQCDLVLHAVALARWHQTQPRCPECGGVTLPEQAGHVRRCPADSLQLFPRQDPAVIVMVTDPARRQALLGRQPSWPAGRFSCLAGFVEAGESAEQAVCREVAEESGVAVRDVRWWGSQPWPFPASLMLAFTAVAEPGPVRPCDGELAEIGWFSRAQTREMPPPPVYSVAAQLLVAFRDGELTPAG